jgi:16S rRNA (guanine(966)-N(2))-methyltransferase RsmD
MRITGGELKGRRIAGKGLGLVSSHGVLRASSSKTRESVFNILAGRVEGSAFLDLYSGTGAVGAEAMSRKAAAVYFVEAERRRALAIEELLKGCGCRDRAKVVNSDALGFIEKAERQGALFDIVFLDPPYRTGELARVLPALGRGAVLSEGALVLAEHESKAALPDEAGVLRKKKTYKYGDTSLTLYERTR